MRNRIRQRVEGAAGGITQVAGGDQKNVRAKISGGDPGGGGGGSAVAKLLALLLGLAALVLLGLGIAGSLSWTVVVVPLVVALVVAVGALAAAFR